MQKNVRISVVGAGPGGLTAAMLLAASGAEVTVWEAQDRVGGRSRRVKFDGHAFDIGATFFMMPWALEEIVRACGFRLQDLLPLARLDPMYRLVFRGPVGDTSIDATQDIRRMVRQLDAIHPGDGAAFRRFMDENRRKLEAFTPVLRNAIRNPLELASITGLKAARHIKPWESVYGNLARRFHDERVRLAMCFQSKYLGMSPFDCPSLFTILPFIEYEYGVWHPEGGVGALFEAIARACETLGVTIRTESPVESIAFDGRRASGVVVDGELHPCDQVVVNADATWAIRNLLPGNLRPRKWSDRDIDRKKYSCSTWMSYLAIDGELDIPHHTICFSPDYRKNLHDITHGLTLSDEPSMYFCNPAPIDPTVAPPGKSSLYCLLPTPNCRADIDWAKETPRLHGEMIDQLHRLGVTDIEKRILGSRVITPADWQAENIHLGATFNLAHGLGQMLHRRPQHRLQGVDGVWMVGGGTHPGSGLPVIFLASQTTSRMLCEETGLRNVLKEHAPLVAARAPVGVGSNALRGVGLVD
ncbi:MAG: phytoene desaturase family protein [Phycisphaerales bacterium]|nr:phytoene desaturase family protein [Phycisphaerales bacterium]